MGFMLQGMYIKQCNLLPQVLHPCRGKCLWFCVCSNITSNTTLVQTNGPATKSLHSITAIFNPRVGFQRAQNYNSHNSSQSETDK
ncbi:hypothetical protein XELAEV_18043458mg [Xenopus laevis]|uniref:Uncharacterized protein n=1 Tax=Xenopus laevis TaxID=8355 RepID=A0A974BX02_XENLA|nr:hypothetical protein XELAEV_18043458mg [Xenopus laevis]